MQTLSHRSNNYRAAPPLDQQFEARYFCPIDAFCQPASAKGCELWWLVSVREISRSSINLLSKRPYPPGTFLAIELETPKQRFPRILTARVLDLQARDGFWIVQCGLGNELDDEEMRALPLRPAS